MKFKNFIKNIIPKTRINVYIIIFGVFIIWMLFLDENSYLTLREFNKEIDKLEKLNNYHKKKIKEDKKTIKKLKNTLELERYAREKYLMKRKNEDLYIIELDTIKNND